MGSVVGTIKDTIDSLEEKGKSVGLLQICSFRPFPRKQVYQLLKNKENIVVVEKALSLGRGGILVSEALPLFTEYLMWQQQPWMTTMIFNKK